MITNKDGTIEITFAELKPLIKYESLDCSDIFIWNNERWVVDAYDYVTQTLWIEKVKNIDEDFMASHCNVKDK